MTIGHHLSIDFGTSHTVGIVAWADGKTTPLLFDGSPLLPSAVYADDPAAAAPRSEGMTPRADSAASQAQRGIEFLVGRDAIHAARSDPSRFEDAPKRRIDDGSVLLGEHECTVQTMIAAVLARVRDEAVRVLGAPPHRIVMSHPATWGVSRRLILLEAAARSGLGEPVLMAEPVAAAHYFATVIGKRFPDGHGLLVYDFGGGTFDASLVVRDAGGYDVRAVDGIDDLGGLDFDEIVVKYIEERVVAEHAEHADALRRLATPRTVADRRYRRMLWEDARIAKERLSRAQSATVHVPLAGIDITVTRDAFESLARPLIERTVRSAASVLRWSKLPTERLVGVFLVGGSSRIPLVTPLIQRQFGIAPTVMEQPELVVAEGALHASQLAAFASAPTQVAPMQARIQPSPVPDSQPAPPPQAGPPPAGHLRPVRPPRSAPPAQAVPPTRDLLPVTAPSAAPPRVRAAGTYQSAGTHESASVRGASRSAKANRRGPWRRLVTSVALLAVGAALVVAYLQFFGWSRDGSGRDGPGRAEAGTLGNQKSQPVSTVGSDPKAATESGSSTSSQTYPRCAAKRLSVTLGETQSTAVGDVAYEGVAVIFTNVGDAPCRIAGYPGADALAADSATLAEATRAPSGKLGGLAVGASATAVLLAPGKAASGFVEMSAPIEERDTCDRYVMLHVTPPDETESTKLRWSPTVCNGMTVSPVVPGTTGSGAS